MPSKSTSFAHAHSGSSLATSVQQPSLALRPGFAGYRAFSDKVVTPADKVVAANVKVATAAAPRPTASITARYFWNGGSFACKLSTPARHGVLRNFESRMHTSYASKLNEATDSCNITHHCPLLFSFCLRVRCFTLGFLVSTGLGFWALFVATQDHFSRLQDQVGKVYEYQLTIDQRLKKLENAA